MATRGNKIACNACGRDVRLYGLVENDGVVIACGCEDVKHSLDAMPYELGVSHLNDDWYVVDDRNDPTPDPGPNEQITEL